MQCKMTTNNDMKLNKFVNTVKHVYSDHAYNEMTLITKRL